MTENGGIPGMGVEGEARWHGFDDKILSFYVFACAA
jgi:hypothetical protein